MYAIVKTGGKQYKVAADDVIEVEKLTVEPGGIVELEVVFIADGATVTTDTEALLKAKVFATVLEQFKGDKQIIFKFKKRKGYKRLKGHRQNLTKLRIDAISLDGKAPKVTKKTEAKKTEVLDKGEVADKETSEKKTASKKSAQDSKVAPDESMEKKAEKEETVATDEKAAESPKEKPRSTRSKAKAEVDEATDETAEEKPKKKAAKKADEDTTEE